MDVDQIREYLDPVPDEILSTVENEHEKDYLKKEYRSIQRYEKYLSKQEALSPKKKKKRGKKKKKQTRKARPVTTAANARRPKLLSKRPTSAAAGVFRVKIPAFFSKKATKKKIKPIVEDRESAKSKKERKKVTPKKQVPSENELESRPNEKKVSDIPLIINREFTTDEKVEISKYLELVDEIGFDACFVRLNKEAKSKGKLNLNLFFYGNEYFPNDKKGFSQYLMTGGVIKWVEVEILEKVGYNRFKIKFKEFNREKVVGRINLYFSTESQKEFLKENLFAIIRRRHREREIFLNKEIKAISMDEIATVSEDQIDRIMKLVGKSFPVKTVGIIKSCLLDLEMNYVHSLKKSIFINKSKKNAREFTRRERNKEFMNFQELFDSSFDKLSESFYFLNPIFFKILLLVNKEIEMLNTQEVFKKENLDYPLEIYQFIELEKKQILLFLKFFRKEFFIKVINIIQRNITNDIYNFYKIDNLIKYNRSKMKNFIELINYILSTKITRIVLDKVDDFLRFLSETNESFFKIKLVADMENQKITYSPTFECIVEYIETEIIHFFINELNKYNNTTNEIYSSLNFEKRLFSFQPLKIGKYFTKKIRDVPAKIMEEYTKLKDYCFVYNSKYVPLFIEKNGGIKNIKLIQFKNELLRIMSLRNEFYRKFEVFSQFVKIELGEIELMMLKNLDEAKMSILKYLSDYCYSLNVNIAKNFREIFDKLKKIPSNPEELNVLKQYTLTVKDQMISLLKIFKKVESYMKILNEFEFTVNEKYFGVYIKTFEWPNKIEKLLSNTEEKIESLKFSFMETLKKETMKLNNQISDFNKQICEIKNFNNLEYLEDYYKKISFFREQIVEFKEKVKLFNSREELFAFPQKSTFPSLAKIEKEYSAYFELFKIIFEENTEFPKWNEGKFFNITYDDIKSKIRGWLEQLDKLKIKDLSLFKFIHDKLTKFLPNLKMIKYLLEPGLKVRHWKKILPSYQEIENLKLIDLIDLNLIDKIDEIKKISLRAKQEFWLENKILKIDDNLRRYKFENIKVIIANLNDYLVDLVKLKNNKLSKFFMNDMKNLELKILEIIELLNLYKNFEKKYHFLRKIISDDDDDTNRPPHLKEEESKKFGLKINKTYVIIEQNFQLLSKKLKSLKYLDQILLIKYLKNSFKRFFKLIDEIEKNLVEFIENERRRFPKFYFIDTRTLIKNYNNLGYLLNSLFKFKGNYSIRDGAISLLDGKLVIDNRSFKNNTNLLIEIDKKLKSFLRVLVTSQKLSRDNLPNQVKFLKDNISFFNKVELIMEEQKFRGLQKFAQTFEIDESDPKLIIMNKLTLKNVLEKLIEREVQSRNELFYRRLIRFYLNPNEDGTLNTGIGDTLVDDNVVEIQNMLHRFQYGFEYAGEDFRVPVTYFQNFEIGMNYVKENFWFVPHSFEFLDEFSNLLGKNLVVFNCYKVDAQQLSCMLKGTIQGNSYCGLFNVSIDVLAKLKALNNKFANKKNFNIDNKMTIDFSKDYDFGFFIVSRSRDDPQNKGSDVLYQSLFKDMLSEHEQINMMMFLKSKFLLLGLKSVNVLINKLLWVDTNLVKINWSLLLRLLEQFIEKKSKVFNFTSVMKKMMGSQWAKYKDYVFNLFGDTLITPTSTEKSKERQSITEEDFRKLLEKEKGFVYRDEFHRNFNTFLKYYLEYPIVLKGQVYSGKSIFRKVINLYFGNKYRYKFIEKVIDLEKYLFKSGNIIVIYKKMEKYYFKGSCLVVGEVSLDLREIIQNDNIILIVNNEIDDIILKNFEAKIIQFSKIQIFKSIESEEVKKLESLLSVFDAEEGKADLKYNIYESFKLLFDYSNSFLWSLVWSFGCLFDENEFVKKYSEYISPYVEDLKAQGVEMTNVFNFYYTKKKEIKFFKNKVEKYSYFVEFFHQDRKLSVYFIDKTRSMSVRKFYKKEIMKISNPDFMFGKLKDRVLYFKTYIPERKVLSKLMKNSNTMFIRSQQIITLKGFHYIRLTPDEEEKNLGELKSEEVVKKTVIDRIITQLKKRVHFSLPTDNYVEQFKTNQEKLEYIQFELSCFLLKFDGCGEENLAKKKKVFETISKIFEEDHYKFTEPLFLLKDESLSKIDLSKKGKQEVTTFLNTKDGKLIYFNYVIKIIAQLTLILSRKQNRNVVVHGINNRLLKRILKTCCKVLNFEFLNFERILSAHDLKIQETNAPLVFFKYNEREHDELSQVIRSHVLIFVNCSLKMNTKNYNVYFDDVSEFEEDTQNLNFEEKGQFTKIFQFLTKKNEIFPILKFYFEKRSQFAQMYKDKINDFDQSIKNRLFLQHKIIKLKEEKQFINLNLIKTKILKEELYLKNIKKEKEDAIQKKGDEEKRLAEIKLNLLRFDDIKGSFKLIKKKVVRKNKKINKKMFGLFKKVFFKIDTRTSKNYFLKLGVLVDNYEYEDFTEEEKVDIKKELERLVEIVSEEDIEAKQTFDVLKTLLLFTMENNDLVYDLTHINELQKTIEEKNSEIRIKEDTLQKLKNELEENIEKLNQLNFKIKKKERKLEHLRERMFEKQKEDFEKKVKLRFIIITCFYMSNLMKYKENRRTDILREIFGDDFIDEGQDNQFIDNLSFFVDYTADLELISTSLHLKDNVNYIVLDYFTRVKKNSIFVVDKYNSFQIEKFMKVVDCSDITNFDNLKKIIDKVRTNEQEYIALSHLSEKFAKMLKGDNYVFFEKSKEKFNYMFINNNYVDLQASLSKFVKRQNLPQYQNHIKFFLSIHYLMNKFVSKVNKFYSFTQEFYFEFFQANYEEALEVFVYRFYAKVIPIIDKNDVLLFSFMLALNNHCHRKSYDGKYLHGLLRAIVFRDTKYLIVDGEVKKPAEAKETEENMIETFSKKLQEKNKLGEEEMKVFVFKELGEKFLKIPSNLVQEYPSSNALIVNNNVIDFSYYYNKYENIRFNDVSKLSEKSNYLIEVFDNRKLSSVMNKNNVVLILNNLRDLQKYNLEKFEKISFHPKNFMLFLDNVYGDIGPADEFVKNFLIFHNSFFGKPQFFYNLNLAVKLVLKLYELYKNVDEIQLFQILMNTFYCTNLKDVKYYLLHFMEPMVKDKEYGDLELTKKPMGQRTFKDSFLKKMLDYSNENSLSLVDCVYKSKLTSKETTSSSSKIVLTKVYLINACYGRYMFDIDERINVLKKNVLFEFEKRTNLSFHPLEKIGSAANVVLAHEMTADSDGMDLDLFVCPLYESINKDVYICDIKLKTNKENDYWVRKDVYACLNV